MAHQRTIQRLEARYCESINPVASLGFIGLATDRAGLLDFSDFIAPFRGVTAHATRIPFAEEATPKTLAGLGEHLASGARLLVPGQPLDSISFSCTSGTIAIGTDQVSARVQSVRPQCPVITPIGSAMEALRRLACRRISLLMPYLMPTAEMVADFFEAEGFTLDRIATFDLPGDAAINTVSAERIADAGRELCAPESDALFISCTGWRTHSVIDRLETALQRPVLTSNQTLAWSALRSAGVRDHTRGQGAVFERL